MFVNYTRGLWSHDVWLGLCLTQATWVSYFSCLPLLMKNKDGLLYYRKAFSVTLETVLGQV